MVAPYQASTETAETGRTPQEALAWLEAYSAARICRVDAVMLLGALQALAWKLTGTAMGRPPALGV